MRDSCLNEYETAWERTLSSPKFREEWRTSISMGVLNALAQATATTQFYLYGRRHFTATGWNRASVRYQGDALDSLNLKGKTYLVTGANSGIGLRLSQYLAAQGATLYMACRNPERAEAAVREVASLTGSGTVHALIVDCSVGADVRRAVRELARRETSLDGLVCNAGALLSERTETSEGVEVTFATHLLVGSYLLTQLTLPLLTASGGGRVVYVSSGGMYNTAWPGWSTGAATSDSKRDYDGQLAYAYAKRAQVLLGERLSSRYPAVRFVSCHPGWVDTPGVEAAYGSAKRALQPMRDLWQGTEGIAWLCAAPTAALEPGAFYLDRTPQVKHLAGPFFTEGSFTKNTPQQVDELMDSLESAAAAL